jgi:hypothetical protein
MARLRQIELKALSDALFALYSPGPHTDLPVRMFKALQRCLSFDLLAYHEIWNNQNQRGVSQQSSKDLIQSLIRESAYRFEIFFESPYLLADVRWTAGLRMLRC